MKFGIFIIAFIFLFIINWIWASGLRAINNNPLGYLGYIIGGIGIIVVLIKKYKSSQ